MKESDIVCRECGRLLLTEIEGMPPSTHLCPVCNAEHLVGKLKVQDGTDS